MAARCHISFPVKKHQAYQKKVTRRRAQNKAAAEEAWWDGGNVFVVSGGFSDSDSTRGSRRKRKAASDRGWSFNVKLPRVGSKAWGRATPLEQLFSAAESGRLQELLWMDQWWRFGQGSEAGSEEGKRQQKKNGAGASSQSSTGGAGDNGWSQGGYEEGWYYAEEGPGTRSSGRRSRKKAPEGEQHSSYGYGGEWQHAYHGGGSYSSSSSSSSAPGGSMAQHLKVLGLPLHEQLTKDSLKQAFHKAAKLWHPDRHVCPVAKEDAARHFKNAAEAYEALSLTVK
eukprot:jgi/Mesvir1/29694/Mv00928-RA.1